MKVAYVVALSAAMMLVACDSESTSAESSPYGSLRYERHVPSNESAGACYVYEKGHLFSVLQEQNYGPMGSVSLLSQVEIDGTSLRMYEEVNLRGMVAGEAVTDFCSAEKTVYEEGLGGTVTCTKSKVTAEAVQEVNAADVENGLKTVVARLSESCDEFIEELEANMGSLD